MFRQFGSRVIKDGRRVRDDYWEEKARKQGFTVEDAAGAERPVFAGMSATSETSIDPAFRTGDDKDHYVPTSVADVSKGSSLSIPSLQYPGSPQSPAPMSFEAPSDYYLYSDPFLDDLFLNNPPSSWLQTVSESNSPSESYPTPQLALSAQHLQSRMGRELLKLDYSSLESKMEKPVRTTSPGLGPIPITLSTETKLSSQSETQGDSQVYDRTSKNVFELVSAIQSLYRQFEATLVKAVAGGRDGEPSKMPSRQRTEKGLDQQSEFTSGSNKRHLDENHESEINNASPGGLDIGVKRRKIESCDHIELPCWWYMRDPIRYYACRNYCSRKRDLHSFRRHHFDDHWRWGDVHADGKSFETWNTAKHATYTNSACTTTERTIMKWKQTYKLYWGLNELDGVPQPRCADTYHVLSRPKRPIYVELTPKPGSNSPSLEDVPFHTNLNQNVSAAEHPSTQPINFLDCDPSFFPPIDTTGILNVEEPEESSFAWSEHTNIACDLAESYPDPIRLIELVYSFTCRLRAEIKWDERYCVPNSVSSIRQLLSEFESSFTQATSSGFLDQQSLACTSVVPALTVQGLINANPEYYMAGQCLLPDLIQDSSASNDSVNSDSRVEDELSHQHTLPPSSMTGEIEASGNGGDEDKGMPLVMPQAARPQDQIALQIPKELEIPAFHDETFVEQQVDTVSQFWTY